jgi:prevent-host-death family protein
MKTVNIADLKNRLSSYLQLVREGEEVIVKDRNQPVARITAYDTSGLSESERRLVASGALKLPEEPAPNWDEFCDEFFARPGAKIDQQALIQAVIQEREEGW